MLGYDVVRVVTDVAIDPEDWFDRKIMRPYRIAKGVCKMIFDDDKPKKKKK